MTPTIGQQLPPWPIRLLCINSIMPIHTFSLFHLCILLFHLLLPLHNVVTPSLHCFTRSRLVTPLVLWGVMFLFTIFPPPNLSNFAILFPPPVYALLRFLPPSFICHFNYIHAFSLIFSFKLLYVQPSVVTIIT